MTHINGHSKEDIAKIYTVTLGSIIANLVIYILSVIPRLPPNIKHILDLIFTIDASAGMCFIIASIMLMFIWLEYIPPTINNIGSFAVTATIAIVPALKHTYPTSHIYFIVLVAISIVSAFFLCRGHKEYLSTETELA